MSYFRPKPVIVDAVQFTEAMARGEEPLPEGVRMCRRSISGPPERLLLDHRHVLEVPGGDVEVGINDWIVRELRVFKPAAFAAIYKPL